jgi:Fe-S cluster assembly iron-binding protein IscA
MEKLTNDNNEFWTYCGIKIPIYIKNVPSIDGVNTHYSDGSETEMFTINKPYTLKEYQNKYSVAISNGELFWKE